MRLKVLMFDLFKHMCKMEKISMHDNYLLQ